MIHKTVIGLDEARRALDAMLEHAGSEPTRPVAMAVVDDSGNLIAYARMDGTAFTSAAIAIRKAYTSARMSRDSGAWGEWIGKAGIDPAQFGDPQLCVFQGGVVLKVDGGVVGAIGVSGRAAQEDEDICRIGAAAMGLGSNDVHRAPAGVTEQRYGVTLTNPEGSAVTIWRRGAAIASAIVPDRTGRFADVVLGYASPAGYDTDNTYFGTCIGRYCGRIRDGAFTLDGNPIRVGTNNGRHCLHGGPHGFDQAVWDIVATTDRPASVLLRHESPAGDQGFPGRLVIEVRYTLGDDRSLTIDTGAVADATTVVSTTNHTYFNLAGHDAGSIEGHQLTIAARRLCCVDTDLVDTGDQIAVEDTPFDFRDGSELGPALAGDHSQLRLGYGFDHTFVLDPSAAASPAARLADPGSGRVLELTTDRPGLRLYTANGLAVVGKGGARYRPRSGLCLEAQHLPGPGGSVPASAVLRAGATYATTTRLAFTVDGATPSST